MSMTRETAEMVRELDLAKSWMSSALISEAHGDRQGATDAVLKAEEHIRQWRVLRLHEEIRTPVDEPGLTGEEG